MKDAFVTYHNTVGYTVSLRHNQIIIRTVHVDNYHQLGDIISNWLTSRYGY